VELIADQENHRVATGDVHSRSSGNCVDTRELSPRYLDSAHDASGQACHVPRFPAATPGRSSLIERACIELAENPDRPRPPESVSSRNGVWSVRCCSIVANRCGRRYLW
jgi:hypothetical protein